MTFKQNKGHWAYRWLYLSLFLFVLSTSSVFAQDRPKIGLVLGGGGAAGVAHVGVLKVLEENNIPIDMIAGTSMGAIVGSLYASGKRADELEEIVKSLNWLELFDDNQTRSQQSFRRKINNSGFFQHFELGLNKNGLQFPSGLVTGQKLMFELRKLLSHVSHVQDFDQLQIPFRAVATRIEDGQEVVLKNGNLPLSVRASMAIPGFFSPVKINNQLLVDGFVANNVPVNVAREMGADILIVVNIPTFLEKQNELNSALAVSYQAMQLMLLKSTVPQLAKMQRQDILIEPGIKDIGSLDFDRVAETIPLGEQAARQALSRLRALAVNKPVHQKAPQKQVSTTNPRPIIDRIVINNDSVLDNDILMDELDIQTGQRLNPSRLQRGLENIHGLGYFDLVDHNLVTDAQGKTTLVVNAVKNSTGEQRLRFGFSLADDLDGDSRYQAGVKYIRRGINERGGELEASAILGDTIQFDVELYQPAPQYNAFFDSRISYEERDLFAFDGDDRVAEVRAKGVGLQLDVGRTFGRNREARVGVFYSHRDPELKTGQLFLPGKIDSAGIELQYRLDTRDDDQLPNSGRAFTAIYTQGFEGLGSTEDFKRFTVNWSQAWKQDKHRWLLGLGAGSTFSDSTLITEQLSLGGLGRLTGLAEDQLRGNHSANAVLAYTYDFRAVANAASFFAGGSFELGNVWQSDDDISADSLLSSGSVFIGAKTAFGPIYFGFGKTEGFEVNPFFYLGRGF